MKIERDIEQLARALPEALDLQLQELRILNSRMKWLCDFLWESANVAEDAAESKESPADSSRNSTTGKHAAVSTGDTGESRSPQDTGVGL